MCAGEIKVNGKRDAIAHGDHHIFLRDDFVARFVLRRGKARVADWANKCENESENRKNEKETQRCATWMHGDGLLEQFAKARASYAGVGWVSSNGI
jgi:hypothetical protein